MGLGEERIEGAGPKLVLFPDGRTARSPEEKIQAIRMQKEAEARRDAELNRKQMETAHPQGFAQRKTSDGIVTRKSGTKDW